ncbi:MAG: Protein kinase, partial [Frankiales bacterium]|nr:Protein kinase [Frankiales bacterium]
MTHRDARANHATQDTSGVRGRGERPLSTDEKIIRDWIAREIGGEVVSFRRQPRWRPLWLVDVERDGTVL